MQEFIIYPVTGYDLYSHIYVFIRLPMHNKTLPRTIIAVTYSSKCYSNNLYEPICLPLTLPGTIHKESGII